MINPPIKFALLTVSDRAFAGIRQDLSGPALMDEILSFGGEISAVQIVADDKNAIMRILSQWCDVSLIDIILTTGGTGFSHRDFTPEATLSILDKQTPGLVHAISVSYTHLRAHETVLDLVCRLLLEKKKKNKQ